MQSKIITKSIIEVYKLIKRINNSDKIFFNIIIFYYNLFKKKYIIFLILNLPC